jgi:uncharacterized protein (DUF58 family)
MGKGWWTVVGLLALLSVILRHNLLFLMSLLMGLLGGATLLWTRYCLAGVSYRRRFGSTRLFYGEETDLYVEIVNAKPLPLAWLRIEDEYPTQVKILAVHVYHSYLPGRLLLVNLLALRWYEKVTRHYRLVGTRRGAWKFGPVGIESGDIFGLEKKWDRWPEIETLLVYPKVVPITALGLPAQHPFGDFKTPRRTMEDPIRLMGVREYAPGDSFRHIHWKATAHHHALRTKVFEPSAARPLAIFLNVNTFEYLYEGIDRALQELAITTAASIARYAWENGYHVGLCANSVVQPGGQRVRIQPGNHPDQLIRIFEALARMADYGYGGWPIDMVLQAEALGLRYGTTIVVVSPIVNDRLRKTLLDLRRREYAVTLVGVGRGRLDAPLPGVQYYNVGEGEVWDELAALELA